MRNMNIESDAILEHLADVAGLISLEKTSSVIMNVIFVVGWFTYLRLVGLASVLLMTSASSKI